MIRMILCIIIILLLVQCNAYKKVASDPFRDEKEIATIRPVCAILFPPTTKYVKGETIIDSTGYKELISEVEGLLKNASDEYEKLASTAGEISVENDSLRVATGAHIANLENIIARLKKGIKCPEIKNTPDTIYQVDQAVVEQYQARVNGLQRDVLNTADERDKYKSERDDARSNKNKGWYVSGFLILLIAVYIFGKIKRIIP